MEELHQKTKDAIAILALTVMSRQTVKYGMTQEQVQENLSEAVRRLLSAPQDRYRRQGELQ